MRGVAIGFCAGLVLAGVASRPDAQPAPPAPPAPPPTPDIAKAKALYESATTAMTDGRYPDAVRDFTAAYDLTKDPVLLFKIGTANEKAGACEAALVYFARYLNEAKPEPRFVDATKEHVEACHGDWEQISAGAKGSDTTGSAGSGALLGSAEPGSAAGSDAIGSDAGSGVPLATGSGAGEHPSRGKDAPWLMVGGALAFVTAGVVLAYSASSSEQDIKDLYAGLGNGTPVFDAKNAERYQDLVDEGHRYQYLSWTSFGLAVGFGAVAAILFVRDHNEAIHEQREHALRITPAGSPTSAGVTATLHF